MGMELVWPSLCLAVGLVLLVAEAFIPSGGLIGLLAIGFLVVSLWLAFTTTSLGWLFLLALVVFLPLALALAVQLWPKTPLAKYIFLKPPEEPIGLEDDPNARLDHLVGQYGRALTPLRPSGMVDFEGRRIDSLSEEGLIPSGSLVEAVQVRGVQIVVRKADEQSLDQLLGESQPEL